MQKQKIPKPTRTERYLLHKNNKKTLIKRTSVTTEGLK